MHYSQQNMRIVQTILSHQFARKVFALFTQFFQVSAGGGACVHLFDIYAWRRGHNSCNSSSIKKVLHSAQAFAV